MADAIVNLSRAAAGLAPFDKKDAHELIRYAVRRGLIRSDEGDRVAAEIDGVAVPKPPVKAAQPLSPVPQHAPHHRRPAPKARAPRPKARPKPNKKAAPRPKARAVARRKKK